MTGEHLSETAKKHWFWIALTLVVFGGYQVGKDRALTENAVERASTSVG